jgi:hypothetical protein
VVLQAVGEALSVSEGAELCWKMMRRSAWQKVAGRVDHAHVLSLVHDLRRAQSSRRWHHDCGNNVEEGLLLWRTTTTCRTPQSTSTGTITAGTFGDTCTKAIAGHVEQ